MNEEVTAKALLEKITDCKLTIKEVEVDFCSIRKRENKGADSLADGTLDYKG